MPKPAPPAFAGVDRKEFAPIELGGSTRLTSRRLRRPTRPPSLDGVGSFGRYLGRLSRLFGAR